MEITRKPSPSFKHYLKPTICQKSMSDNDFFRKKKRPQEKNPTDKLNLYA